MQSFLFVNPLSGSYTGQRIISAVTLLNEAGIRPTVCRGTSPADVRHLCRTINESPDTVLVIIAAGDGTVNAVVNGLLPGKVTLAVLPLGTSNVLAAELGIRSVEDGIERITAGRHRPLSVGILETNSAVHRFVLMAGIGFDGVVVRDVRPREKRVLKKGAFALSAMRSTIHWDGSLVDVVTPERKTVCHSVIVCNASRYGGSSVLAPGGGLFSAGFTVACIRNNRRLAYLRLAVELVTGRVATSREIISFDAERVEISGTKPIQVDGDFIGYSPATVRRMDDFARIIV